MERPEITHLASYGGQNCDIDVVRIDGHEYIVASRYQGGACVIHSESCPCKTGGKPDGSF